MQEIAPDSPFASLLLRCLKFSHGAQWHIADPAAPEDFKWIDLAADSLQKPAVDVIFLRDASGSMGGEIRAVRTRCVVFADRIIQQGVNLRLGLVGFGIGGHRRREALGYTVRNLSRYTIGLWPLDSSYRFKENLQRLTLRLLGGHGCCLADRDTADIFPHTVRVVDGPPENARVLVLIADELGGVERLSDIVTQRKRAGVTWYVLGVPGRSRPHQSLAAMIGGQLWTISVSRGAHDFTDILETVATTIACEVTKTLADGTVSHGTDIGAALGMVAEQLKMPPMEGRALPPVLVLISDGQPTDDFTGGLNALMAQPWGRKAVRIAIATDSDADYNVVQRFMGYAEIKPLRSNKPEALIRYIKWISTAVLKAASAPTSQALGSTVGQPPIMHLPIPAMPELDDGPASAYRPGQFDVPRSTFFTRYSPLRIACALISSCVRCFKCCRENSSMSESTTWGGNYGSATWW